jgi:hypothetical protein
VDGPEPSTVENGDVSDSVPGTSFAPERTATTMTDPTPERRSAPSGGISLPSEEAPDGGWRDTDRVLAEIDRLDADLKPRRPGASASPLAPESPPGNGPESGETDFSEDLAPLDAKYSPYLEEHLGLASASLVELGAGLRAMDVRWQELRTAAIRLEQQMEGAAQEVEFLRQHAGEVPMGTIPRGPLVSASETLAARAASHGPPVGAPFGEFTAERYGRTVASVQKRRRAMAGWTIGLAVLISGALLTFTYLAHEATPPIWLAILPLVWLIPVPFFVVSFLATQRIVAQRSLDLAGSS